MRVLFRFLAVMALVVLPLTSTVAQTMSVDLTKIDPDLAAKLLEATKKKEPPATVTVEKAQEWAKIGENVSQAIAATAKALSIEVNEFIKTPVGQWTLFFIFWYIVGKKLWAIVAGILIWISLGAVIWRSFRTFHIPQRQIVGETSGKPTYEYKAYEFDSNDAKIGSAWAHALAFVALSIAMIIIIL